MVIRSCVLAMVLGLVGCATGVPLGSRAELHNGRLRPFAPAGIRRELPVEPTTNSPLTASPQARLKALAVARSLVGEDRVKVGHKHYPQDCSGLVLAAYGEAGVNLMAAAQPEDNAVTAIYRFAREHGRVYAGGWPVAGDLVFFRETYDQNRDGRQNDGLTHIGLVEGVDRDGTIRVIHRVKRGVVVYRMNLNAPDQRVESGTGRKLNDYLRSGSGPKEAALTGQLFAGYATLFPGK